jgi:transposase-like protein
LVTGDAPQGAAWQRCRTHHTINLMAITPKSSWPCVLGTWTRRSAELLG